MATKAKAGHSPAKSMLGVFYPTLDAKSPKPIFGDFNGFPPDSGRISIHFDRFSVIFNQFQPVSISFNLSGTGDSQHDSRESIRANHSRLKPLFL